MPICRRHFGMPLRRILREALAVHADHAMRRPLDQPQQFQQGALARAGMPGDEGHLAGGHLERKLRQRLVAAFVAFADLIELDHRVSPNLRAVVASDKDKGSRHPDADFRRPLIAAGSARGDRRRSAAGEQPGQPAEQARLLRMRVLAGLAGRSPPPGATAGCGLLPLDSPALRSRGGRRSPRGARLPSAEAGARSSSRRRRSAHLRDDGCGRRGDDAACACASAAAAAVDGRRPRRSCARQRPPADASRRLEVAATTARLAARAADATLPRPPRSGMRPAFAGTRRGFSPGRGGTTSPKAALSAAAFAANSAIDRARLRHHQQFRIHLRDRNALADIGLDVRQRHRVQIAGEADRVALGAQPRGAADAMHVILGFVRQVVVEDVADGREYAGRARPRRWPPGCPAGRPGNAAAASAASAAARRRRSRRRGNRGA